MKKLKIGKDSSLIPAGDYCYDKNGLCPYWDKDKTKEKQGNGYCHYMEKGDWNINSSEEKTVEDMKTGEKISPSEIPFGIGLLWDQVKECGINEED